MKRFARDDETVQGALLAPRGKPVFPVVRRQEVGNLQVCGRPQAGLRTGATPKRRRSGGPRRPGALPTGSGPRAAALGSVRNTRAGQPQASAAGGDAVRIVLPADGNCETWMAHRGVKQRRSTIAWWRRTRLILRGPWPRTLRLVRRKITA